MKMVESTRRVRILIVDDNFAMRARLRCIGESLGAEIVGEAADGYAGIEQAGRLQPDIILLDISMPGIGGFDLALEIRHELPALRIIFVTQNIRKIYVEEALKIGARGYVVKSNAYSELEPAVEAVMAGKTFVSAAACGY